VAIIGIVLCLIILVILIRNWKTGKPFDDDHDVTGWIPSRENPGQFFRYDHDSDQYEYCHHRRITFSGSSESGLEIWVCPECGHTENRLPKST